MPGAAHCFVTLKVPLRPLVAVHVPVMAVLDEGAEKLTIVPEQSAPRAANWPEVTPQLPETAQ